MELSVVVPTFNRVDRLRACLDALGRQTVPKDGFEVIVVVDGSADGTQDMLAGYRSPFTLAVVWQENSGQHIARNRGVEAARGRYLLFVDDDLVASPSLIEGHLEVLRAGARIAGIGEMQMRLPPTAEWFVRQLRDGWNEHYRALADGERFPTWLDCYGGNLSLERTTFQAVKGFAVDVRRSHDIELGYRLMRYGVSFVYARGAGGHLYETKRIGQLARDYRAAGASYVRLAERHPPTLSDLLGPLTVANLRERTLRKALNALRVPPRVLGAVGSAMGDRQAGRRWFRVLHRYFYWCGVRGAVRDRRTWRRLMHGTPILMYHAFTDARRGSRFVMPVQRFARQMRWLRRLGYRVIRLEDLLRHWREHRLPPARSVVITIDDGYAETLSVAAPVLRRYGFPATVFLVSGRIGAANTWSEDVSLKGRRLLGEDELARLVDAGFDVGAHTETHPRLPALPADGLRQEIAGSKQRLESLLRRSVRSFAYPYGESNALAARLVEESGFWGACGVEPGLNTPGTPGHALCRIEVGGELPLLRFLLALRTGDTHVRVS